MLQQVWEILREPDGHLHSFLGWANGVAQMFLRHEGWGEPLRLMGDSVKELQGAMGQMVPVVDKHEKRFVLHHTEILKVEEHALELGRRLSVGEESAKGLEKKL